MNEARPYASLSSGLLARKGAAKPAMRPQGFTSFEDLGWNDMGAVIPADDQEAEPIEHVPSSIAALTPFPRPLRSVPTDAGSAVSSEAEPSHEGGQAEASQSEIEIPARDDSVVAQQRAIIERFEAEPAPLEAPLPSKRAQILRLPRPSTVPPGRKAAFTLRLDSERHVRLRLACAVLGRSAQQIVTAALDEALAATPEIEALASRLSAAGTKRN